MAENLGKRPLKGILKNSPSIDKPDSPKKKHKVTQWDEMNIIATLHPPDKDYGHMRIQEPKTPYNWEGEEGSGDEPDGFDAQLLAEKLRIEGELPPKGLAETSDSDEDEETPEQEAQRKIFASKRKAHYNEYYAVKLARKLMEGDDREEDNDIEMLEV
ncbi:protein phosphatase inhibitor 2 [Anabrus simplex]|uniref:protein phosphatase inhibitor 2 n=1 Tax=Anabrus simplex TaxID=316456 RepID=UPI0034DDBD45